jgi:hypothetical protein
MCVASRVPALISIPLLMRPCPIPCSLLCWCQRCRRMWWFEGGSDVVEGERVHTSRDKKREMLIFFLLQVI